MREIKFKAKRTDGKGWVYGSLVNNLWRKSNDGKQVCEIITTDVDGYDGDSWDDVINELIFEVLPETVCQFINKEDLNDKEMFIDDLFFDSDGSIFKIIQLDCGRYAGKMVNNWYIDEFIEFKNINVIGNIHD